MKLFFSCFFLLVILFPEPVFAEEIISLEGEPFFNQTGQEIMEGTLVLNPIELAQTCIDQLLAELRNCRASILSLLFIAAISGVLQILQSSSPESVSEIGFFACFTLMTIAAMQIFSDTVGYGTEVILSLTDFITKLAPLFTALLVSCGAITSAAAFHPVLAAAVYCISLLVEKCLIPLIYFSAILGIIGHITPRIQLSNATRLIRSFARWILTAALTLFTGITALYGFSAPVLDSMTAKGIKFAVGSFVPVIGGLLSDTVETVLSGTRLMKNAVGTAGLICVISICAVPILKIFVMLLMLKLCAAATEPLTDKRVGDMLGDIAGSVTTVFTMVLTVSMLFIICIGIMIAATT